MLCDVKLLNIIIITLLNYVKGPNFKLDIYGKKL